MPSAWLSMSSSSAELCRSWARHTYEVDKLEIKNENEIDNACACKRFIMIKKKGKSSGQVPWFPMAVTLTRVIFSFYSTLTSFANQDVPTACRLSLKEKSLFLLFKRSPWHKADVVRFHNRQYSLDGRRRKNSFVCFLIDLYGSYDRASHCFFL